MRGLNFADFADFDQIRENPQNLIPAKNPEWGHPQIKSSEKIYKKTLIREILNFLKNETEHTFWGFENTRRTIFIHKTRFMRHISHQNLFILIFKILNVWSPKIREILKFLGTVHPRN